MGKGSGILGIVVLAAVVYFVLSKLDLSKFNPLAAFDDWFGGGKYIDQASGYLRNKETGQYTVPVSAFEEQQAIKDIAWSRTVLCPSDPSILAGDRRCGEKATATATLANMGIAVKPVDYPTSPVQAVEQKSEYYFDVNTGSFVKA